MRPHPALLWRSRRLRIRNADTPDVLGAARVQHTTRDDNGNGSQRGFQKLLGHGGILGGTVSNPAGEEACR